MEIKFQDVLDAFEAIDAFPLDDDRGDTEVRIDREYSGRSMYGRTCFGFTVKHLRTAFEFFAAVGEVIGLDDAIELAGQAQIDNMGYDYVVYFPRTTLTD